jgi:phage terminase Nu1 subunit (DNA packaging protein)
MILETRRDFAKRIGVTPQHITRLVRDQRVIIDKESNRVNVEASIDKLQQTRKLDGAATAQHLRWADRGVASLGGNEAADELTTMEIAAKQASLRKLQAQAELTELQRDKEQIARDRERGLSVYKADIDRDLRNVASVIIGALDILPDRLAPVVAPISDQHEVRVLIEEAKQDVLQTINQNLSALLRAHYDEED